MSTANGWLAVIAVAISVCALGLGAISLTLGGILAELRKRP
jgi:hypothetical protein